MLSPTPYRHYRLCNASFAFVTAHEHVGEMARQLADRAHHCGVLLGVVTLCGRLREPLDSLGALLQPLLAVAVVEDGRPKESERLVDVVARAIDAASVDGTSPWCGHAPSIVQVPLSLAESPAALERLVAALRNYREPCAGKVAPVSRETLDAPLAA
jgi:hypothetical protein